MPTAKEVAQELRGMNTKQISPIPEEMRVAVPSVYIFNVGPKSHLVPLGSWGMHFIPACEAGEPFSAPHVLPGIMFEGIATDMKKIEMRPESGRKVALDIVGKGPFKHASQNLERFGVFIAAGEVPTDAELADARAKLNETYLKLVQEGDELALQGPMQVVNISADHRAACAATNQDRDWAKAPKVMANCPGCGNTVNPGVAICGGRYGCGAILDQEKALALGLIQPAEPKQERAKRA